SRLLEFVASLLEDESKAGLFSVLSVELQFETFRQQVLKHDGDFGEGGLWVFCLRDHIPTFVFTPGGATDDAVALEIERLLDQALEWSCLKIQSAVLERCPQRHRLGWPRRRIQIASD